MQTQKQVLEPWPRGANAGKGSHFLKNVISTTNKSYEPSTVYAHLANTYYSPKINDNSSEIVVSASQDDRGASPANAKEAWPLGGKMTELGYRQSEDGKDFLSY